MGKWQNITLREAGVILIDCDHRTPPAAISGYPYVTIPQLKNGRIDLAGVRYINNEHFKEWTKKANPEPYDVVLSRRCNPGETAFVPPGLNFALGQNLVLLRASGSKVIPEYLRWLTRGDVWWEQVSKFINVGAIFDSLRCADIPNFILPIPPIQEQHSIANLLQSLDNRIELNQRMNKTLEAIAQALFKSWFVDFDPVRAKMEGRQPFGMDEETAALFPDAFEDSVLGEIPRGWTVKPLSEAVDINPVRKLHSGQIAPYLEMSNMPNSLARVSEWKNRALTSGMKFINGDTLVARITPCLENGKTAFIDFLDEGQVGWGSTEYLVFHSKTPLPPEYSYFIARSDTFRAHAIRNMTGTSGRQRVQIGCFDSYLITVPSNECASLFGAMAKSTMAAMKQHDEESQTLTFIRDLLLPKLLSGEIRVKEAEKLVEATI